VTDANPAPPRCAWTATAAARPLPSRLSGRLGIILYPRSLPSGAPAA